MFLQIRHVANSRKLNDLRIKHSCLPQFRFPVKDETKSAWMALQYHLCWLYRPPTTNFARIKEVLCKPHSSIAAVFSAYLLSPEEVFSSLSTSTPPPKSLRKHRPPLSSPRRFCASPLMA